MARRFQSFENRFSWLPGFIRYDFLRKAIALIFALFIWLNLRAKLAEEKVDEDIMRGVPVIVDAGSDLMILSSEKVLVDVTVEGPKKQIKLLDPNDIKVNVSLKAKEFPAKDKIVIEITSKNVTVPYGMKIISIAPEKVEVVVDKKISKKLPVQPRFSGSLPSDYELGKVRTLPETVTLSGPRSEIEGLTMLSTDPIPLNNSVGAFDFNTRISMENLSNCISSPGSVTAQVEVYRKYENRTFMDVPVRILDMPGNGTMKYKLSATNTTITVSGLKDVVEVMDASKVKAFIDLSGIDRPGSYPVRVESSTGDSGVTVKLVEPSVIQVDATKN